MSERPEWIEDGETVRWHGGRAPRMVLVPVALLTAGWLVAVGVLGGGGWFLFGRTVGVGAAAVVTVVALGLAITQVQTTRNAEYVLTDRALYVRDGATFTEPRRVDHAMIRDVYVEETPFERLLGLGVVVVETETDEVWLYGLTDPGRAAEGIDDVAVGDG